MAENPTQLDSGQVIPASYDEVNHALRVNVVATAAGSNTTAINDGSNPSIEATVLPASTAPTTTNTALVVAISPNTPINVTTTVETEGQYNTVLPTVTSGNSAPIQVDSNARLLVSSIANPLPAGTNSLGSIVNITGTVTLPTNAAEETGGNLASLNTKTAGALVPVAYNEVDLTYITSGNGTGQIGTAVYKLASSTVKTLTLTYDSSNRLSTVVSV
jgi:hypothetical protein